MSAQQPRRSLKKAPSAYGAPESLEQRRARLDAFSEQLRLATRIAEVGRRCSAEYQSVPHAPTPNAQ